MNSRLYIYFRIVRFFWYTLRFNLKYFPLKTALKFPIVFYCRPKFRALKGAIHLETTPRFRMIGLGYPGNSMKSSNGNVFWENKGGTVVFKGKFGANPDFSLKVEKDAELVFGTNCSFGQNNFIACQSSISFGDDLLSSWDNQFFDHDFHRFFSIESKELTTASKPIVIGEKVFIGARCTILKGTTIPFRSVVGTNSVLNKHYGDHTGTLINGNPAVAIPRKLTRVVTEPFQPSELVELSQL